MSAKSDMTITTMKLNIRNLIMRSEKSESATNSGRRKVQGSIVYISSIKYIKTSLNALCLYTITSHPDILLPLRLVQNLHLFTTPQHITVPIPKPKTKTIKPNHQNEKLVHISQHHYPHHPPARQPPSRCCTSTPSHYISRLRSHVRRRTPDCELYSMV